jgi:hypothetical protein
VVTRGCDEADRVVVGGQPAAVVADCQNQLQWLPLLWAPIKSSYSTNISTSCRNSGTQRNDCKVILRFETFFVAVFGKKTGNIVAYIGLIQHNLVESAVLFLS